MKRALALSLLCGWVLVKAPPESNDPVLPIESWIAVGSFDTAKECEHVRERIAKHAGVALSSSRCVSSEAYY